METPFQPGAPPSPPLAGPGLGLGLLVLAGQLLWELLNQRGQERRSDPAPGTEITFPGGDQFRILRWKNRTVSRGQKFCETGQEFTDTSPPFGDSAPYFGNFSKLSIGGTSFSNQNVCGSGANVPQVQQVVYQLRTADGTVVSQFTAGNGGVTYVGNQFAGTQIFEATDFSVQTGSTVELLKDVSKDPLPDAVAPRRPGALPAATPGLVPVPASVPALPQAPPVPAEAQPLPGPGSEPGGLPQGGAAPALLPGLRPGGGQAISRVTPGSGSGPITAGGSRPPAALPPSPTNPGSTFLPGGVELPPVGPRPTPEGMANELGKLERKLEIALAPEGPLSLLELLNKVIDQVENIEFLIERLFPPEPYRFDPGAYQLAPVCDRDSEGNLIEPLQAPWAGGEGEFTELRQRLDALAQLVQHHKTLKQPTCGGRGNGPASNVTVHFESD